MHTVFGFKERTESRSLRTERWEMCVDSAIWSGGSGSQSHTGLTPHWAGPAARTPRCTLRLPLPGLSSLTDGWITLLHLRESQTVGEKE
ncbi:unnamed protein product [Gadus morhua 'NCC']